MKSQNDSASQSKKLRKINQKYGYQDLNQRV